MELDFFRELAFVRARAEEYSQSVQPAVEARHVGASLHATENAVDGEERGVESLDLFA